jgi:hypothetical protein
MIRTFFTLTQISICLASGPKIVAEVDHEQGSAYLLSCVNKTTEHYILQKDDPSDRMALTSSQIYQLCLASSISKMTDQSDQKVLGPSINISDPTTPLPKQGIYPSVAAFSTATPRPTTIVWSWWRITDSVRRQSIGLKRPTSIPISSPKPPTVTVTSLIQSTVTDLAPSGVQKSVTSTQPTAVTTTATSTVTAGQMDASTPSKSQIRHEKMEKELKIFRILTPFLQILTGFIG